MKTNKLILISFIVILILLGLLYVIVGGKLKTPSPGEATPSPLPTNAGAEYSNLYKLIPGKSTFADVEKINGKALRVETSGNQSYLYYNAPFGKENVVLVQDNIVVYSSEYVFGEYRGSYNSFVKAFGEPDLTLYERGFLWKVFLSRGLAVQGSSDEIARIIYFVPDDRELFYSTVFVDFGFSESPTGLGE